VELNGVAKHSSLLQHSNNYGCKSFIVQTKGAFFIKRLTAVIKTELL